MEWPCGHRTTADPSVASMLFLLGAALSSTGAFNSAELGFAEAGPLAF